MCENADKSPGWCRDQLDIGMDLIRTAMNAMFNTADEGQLAAASTIEQGMKFLEPGRELLNLLNSEDVERSLASRRVTR